MENKLSTLARDFSLENLENYLLDKGFTVDISPVYDIQDIEEKYKVSDIKEIGRIRLKQNSDLVVFAIKLDNLTERTSKKNQFDIAKRLLERYQKFYGLFVFYDDNKNFRLSFVFKTTYGTKATYSHYKRFTFYVSPNLPNKTFINQLQDCDFTDLDSIKQAFSTQPITREFYNELQNWYYYALDKVKFPDDYKYSDDPEKDREIRNAQSLIRLLTRLMFIWFLKEKGLVPSKLFDEKELKNIVKDFGKGNNYYNAILQNLFFATLNRPIEERGWAEDKGFPANKKDFGVKSLYRYEDKFLISKEEVISELFKNIPFINGGLFDCLDKDKVYIDGFSRNEKKQAKISDELFFSKEKTVDLSKYGLSKNAEVRGLIDILKSYNFTTDEATPIDQEIALDPELLGKVFENLLASYNPETNTTARKSTGSYYTPREIVDYMVEESLREYLKTKVPEAENILDGLFSYSDEELNISDDLRKKLIEAIDQIKIIDPACGSGAFPMGILHKLVFLLQKLDPSNKVWYEIQVDRIKKESKEVLEIAKDENTLKELLNEVKEHFDESINYPDYARKLYLIENCIYGVDIQPIAIQISKLRFFVSLILDQKVDRKKPNFGILALPNLETKFISANALIGLESTQKHLKVKRDSEIGRLIERLEQELKFLRHRYFRIKSRAEKIQLQNKDKELREKLKNALINDGWNDKVAEKIANFDIFDQNASADWFDPEWMFGVVDGFDIVIGNPPYVRQEKIKPIKPILQKQNYEVFTSTADLYVYFYEKGYKLLKDQGILAYITSNKWMRAKYGEKLRKFLKEKTTILEIIDFSGYKVFEQTVDTNILIFKKEKPSKEHIFRFLEVKGDIEDIEEYLRKGKSKLIEQATGKGVEYLDSWSQVDAWQELRTWQTMYQSKLSDNAWTLGDDSVLRLKEKVEKVGRPLKDWDVKIYYGIKTGFNEAFIINSEKRDEILRNCKTEEERKRTEEIIKPVLRGRDIEKYRYKWAGLWIIVIPAGWTNKHRGRKNPEEFFKESFSSLYNHFMSFSNVKGKGKGLFDRDDQGDYWWELRHCDYYSEFEKEKIVWQEIVREPSFAYDNAGMYVEATAFLMTGKNLKYIIGLLNSKPVAFFFKTFYAGGGLGEDGYRYKKAFLEQLPIPPITKENQPIADQIIQKVDQILTLTQSEDYDANQAKQKHVKRLEHEIDQLVYQLYNLTDEEIKIIERGYNG
jgi:type II restriction/modification system DNA methylase subunit YeeA